MLDKLRKILQDGEGLTVEFKRCKNELAKNVYETVSAFSNRYGGYILLGVEDDGKVSGVNPEAVTQIKKGFSSTLNNSQKITPTLFLSLEEANIDGKTVLWCYVPTSSQLVMLDGAKIFDRAEDGDMEITCNSEMVTHIHRRKVSDYSERTVFPYAKAEDLEFTRLMPKVRRLAAGRFEDHPWVKMSDEEIIQSAGLYEEDFKTGKSGYNLAAILLFGRDEVIRSCTANYITDAICRRENLDRYDDRLMVTTNLIDAYEQLIDFIAKHTLDRFHIINGLSVSLRSGISRELVSNILVHREYTSAYPAKIIIERERIVTENWSLPRVPGRIDPNSFTPYPRNPLLARFFINIGRADVLGSGVKNLYQFTKLYSGGEPELIDGDIFKTIVPLSLSNGLMSDKQPVSDKMSDKVSDKRAVSDKMSDKVSDKQPVSYKMSDKVSDKQPVSDKMSDKVSDKQPVSDKTSDKTSDKVSDKRAVSDNAHRQAIFSYLAEHTEINAATTAHIIGRSPGTARRILSQLMEEGILIALGANKNRVYRLKG